MKTKQIVTGKKVILPIWYGINENDLKDISYWLIDKYAAKDTEGISAIAKKIKDICQQ